MWSMDLYYPMPLEHKELCFILCRANTQNNIYILMYQSKWVVMHTSERGCPVHNDVRGRLWYIQIGIKCNIIIITEIYITPITSVTLRFWFFFFKGATPWTTEVRFTKELFIDYFRVHNSALAIDDFYWLFLRKKHRARHRWAQSVYPTVSLVNIGFLCLVNQSLLRALVQI